MLLAIFVYLAGALASYAYFRHILNRPLDKYETISATVLWPAVFGLTIILYVRSFFQ